MIEAVGEMPQRPASGIQMPLDIGTERAGLNACKTRDFIDLQDAAHAAQVHRDDGAGLVAWSFKTSRNVRSASKRNDHCIRAQGGLDDVYDFLFRTGIHNEIR